MPRNEVTVVKSPVAPVNIPEDAVAYGNELTYYVRLSDGIIVTRPQDFPTDEEKEEEAEEEATD